MNMPKGKQRQTKSKKKVAKAKVKLSKPKKYKSRVDFNEQNPELAKTFRLKNHEDPVKTIKKLKKRHDRRDTQR